VKSHGKNIWKTGKVVYSKNQRVKETPTVSTMKAKIIAKKPTNINLLVLFLGLINIHIIQGANDMKIPNHHCQVNKEFCSQLCTDFVQSSCSIENNCLELSLMKTPPSLINIYTNVLCVIFSDLLILSSSGVREFDTELRRVIHSFYK
jgi:hypothetical protein